MDRINVLAPDFSANVTPASQTLSLGVQMCETYKPTPSVEMRASMSLLAANLGAPQTATITLIAQSGPAVAYMMLPGPPCRAVCSVPVTAGAIELHSLSIAGTVIDSVDLSAGAMGEVDPSPDGLYEIEMIGAVWAAVPIISVWQL
jgi:hypothetical protein